MTRDEFEAALRVLKEGRPTHPLYAVEEAKHALKRVARYYWRRSAVITLCVLWPAIFSLYLLSAWPWFASYFAGALAGIALYVIVMKLTPVRRFLAPPGLDPEDVVKAAHALLPA